MVVKLRNELACALLSKLSRSMWPYLVHDSNAPMTGRLSRVTHRRASAHWGHHAWPKTKGPETKSAQSTNAHDFHRQSTMECPGIFTNRWVVVISEEQEVITVFAMIERFSVSHYSELLLQHVSYERIFHFTLQKYLSKLAVAVQSYFF